jgi:hypothetical protein
VVVFVHACLRVRFLLRAQVAELCRLCRICKGWRDIILENQDLWSHVNFKPCERKVTGDILERLLSGPRCTLSTVLSLVHLHKHMY